MDAKDAIRSSANLCEMVLKSYISDLDDADLMRRPTDGCNHLAWQLGHLISSEVSLLGLADPDHQVALPDGFEEAHSKETAGSDDASGFQSKDEYVALFDKVRAGTMAALEAYDPAKLDSPSPEHMRSFCPTMGDVFSLIATHPMMHAGQFVIVRRQLGKPILM